MASASVSTMTADDAGLLAKRADRVAQVFAEERHGECPRRDAREAAVGVDAQARRSLRAVPQRVDHDAEPEHEARMRRGGVAARRDR